MVDVLVIGGGLSGTVAALSLVAGGAKVALARRGWGATAAFNGSFDLALSPALSALGAAAPHHNKSAASIAAPWPLEKHVDDIVSHQPLHPFATLGATASLTHMASGYALLQQALAQANLYSSPLEVGQACSLFPNSNGSLSPTGAMMQPADGPYLSAWDDAADRSKPWGVVDLAAAGAALGPRSQAGWLHDAQLFGAPDVQLQQILPHSLGPENFSGPFHLARHLDDLGAAQRFLQQLAPSLTHLSGVIVPPVLGLRNHHQVVAMAQRLWQIPVIEALATMPSVPGVRLMLALEAALARAGVRVVSEINQVYAGKGTFTHATTSAHGDVHAGACVLATGRFWTGGLTWERGARCQESLFGLPVMTATGPLVERSAMEVTRRRPEEPQPLMTAGIGVDHALRPLDGNGEPMSNVRAAGMIIGGFSPRDARCADGVALATAHHAAAGILTERAGDAPC